MVIRQMHISLLLFIDGLVCRWMALRRLRRGNKPSKHRFSTAVQLIYLFISKRFVCLMFYETTNLLTCLMGPCIWWTNVNILHERFYAHSKPSLYEYDMTQTLELEVATTAWISFDALARQFMARTECGATNDRVCVCVFFGCSEFTCSAATHSHTHGSTQQQWTDVFRWPPYLLRILPSDCRERKQNALNM